MALFNKLYIVQNIFKFFVVRVVDEIYRLYFFKFIMIIIFFFNKILRDYYSFTLINYFRLKFIKLKLNGIF